MLFLQVVCNRSSEVEELKSIIETLRENQARLQKDNAEEIEQLHEVIEKLQRELPLRGPETPKARDGGAMSLQSELLGLPAEGAEAPAMLAGELHAALEAKEALSQRLAEQERQHSQALEALQQRLQAAEEAATRQLAELGPEDLASQIHEFEAALRAREAKIAERDLEIEALRRQKSTHSAELEAILAAVARFRHALEQQLLAATGEPPELQRLREQCVCLSHQLQALNQRFLKCQKELDERQARGEGCSQGWVPGGEEASRSEELQQDVDGRQLAQARDSRGSDPQVGSFLCRLQLVQPVCAESWVHIAGWGVCGVQTGCWECRQGAEQLLDICGRPCFLGSPSSGTLWPAVGVRPLSPTLWASGRELWFFPQAQLAGSPMGPLLHFWLSDALGCVLISIVLVFSTHCRA